MMMTQNQIMELLNQGMSVDQIANDFTAQLNAAIQEKEKLEKEKKANSQKLRDAETLLNTIFDFGEKYYPDIFDGDMRAHVKPDHIVEAMDHASEEVRRMEPMLKKLREIAEIEIPTATSSVAPAPKKIAIPKDDPLLAFLKSQNLV